MTGRTGGAQGAAVTPARADVRLVTVVPFETPAWSLCVPSALPEGLRYADLPSGADLPRPPAAGLLEDLHLWDYGDALAAELTDYLPHRVTRVEVAGGTCPRPPAPPGAGWELESCVVDLWDVGVGMVTAVHRLEGPVGCWEDVRDSVVQRSVKQRHLAQADTLIGVVLGALCPGEQDGDRGAREVGRGLWVQEVFLVEAHEDVAPEQLDEVCRVLTDGGGRIDPGVDADAVAVRLGIEVCVASLPAGRRAAHAVGRVVSCQTAVWAAAITLDLDLAGLLKRATRDEVALPLEHLEARALELLGVFEEVERFGAVVGTVAMHLAVRDKAYWECFHDAWGLDAQLRVLDTNLDAIGHVYVHLTNALAARQARSLNDVLLAITMLNLAMFWIAVWEFTQKSFDPFSTVSAVVVVAALVSSCGLFFGVRRLTRATSATIARLDAGRARGREARPRTPVAIPRQAAAPRAAVRGRRPVGPAARPD